MFREWNVTSSCWSWFKNRLCLSSLKSILLILLNFLKQPLDSWFSYDVTAAILVSPNKETTASGNCVLFICKLSLLFRLKNMAADQVSESQQLLLFSVMQPSQLYQVPTGLEEFIAKPCIVNSRMQRLHKRYLTLRIWVYWAQS